MFALAELLIHADTQSGRLLCAQSLYDYTKNHFAHEEHLMTQSDYPELHEHKQQHDHLLAMLDRIAQDIEAGVVKLHDLERLVSDWLVSHINTSDAKLSLFLGVTAEQG
jgi:hemerythrin